MAAPKKQFCVHDHDTFICGRDKAGNCKDCAKIRNKIWYDNNRERHAELTKKYYNEHKEKLLERSKQYNIEHPEEVKIYKQTFETNNPNYNSIYYDGHKEEIATQTKIYYEENKDWIIELNKKWAKEHPEKVREARLKCQTERSLRIVAWTDWLEINNFERNKPEGMTTDHIIPLKGKFVWGLHVDWNLQYMTRTENSKKHNKCNLLEASEWYGQILKQAGLK